MLRARLSARSIRRRKALRFNSPVKESCSARSCICSTIGPRSDTSCTNDMIDTMRPKSSVSAELNHSQ